MTILHLETYNVINDRPRPAPSSVFSSYYAHSNTTDFDENDVSNSTALNPVVIYPLLRALSSDIFTGQIIASLIVFAFLGVFLLREWIIQNARPGVFEDNAIEHVQEAVDGGREEDVPVEGEQREDQEERNGPVNDGPFVNASAQTTRNSSRSDFLLLDGDDADKGVGSSTIGIMFDASDPTETRSSEEEVQIIDPVGPPPRRRRRIHGEAHPRHERPPARESRSHSWNRQPQNNRRLFSSSRSSDSISPEGSGSTLPIETSVNNSGSASEAFSLPLLLKGPNSSFPRRRQLHLVTPFSHFIQQIQNNYPNLTLLPHITIWGPKILMHMCRPLAVLSCIVQHSTETI